MWFEVDVVVVCIYVGVLCLFVCLFVCLFDCCVLFCYVIESEVGGFVVQVVKFLGCFVCLCIVFVLKVF